MTPEMDQQAQAERVEQLLRCASEWEPDAPAPAGFAFRALAVNQAREDERARRAVGDRRRVILFGAFAGVAGAGLCCATLALALTRPVVTNTVIPEPHIAVAKGPAAPEASTQPDAKPEPKQVTSHHRAPLRLASTTTSSLHARRRPAGSLRARWTEETVQQEVTRVLAPAWVVDTDEESGAVTATPTVVDVPLSTITCAPTEGQEDEMESTPESKGDDTHDEPTQSKETGPARSGTADTGADRSAGAGPGRTAAGD